MGSVSLSEVLEMEVPERIRLAQAIWDSIAQVPDAVPLSEADKAEIDRRLEAYYRDPKAGLPWSEVKAKLLGRR
jgi:putative addiction module component (TIGR02574 family)